MGEYYVVLHKYLILIVNFELLVEFVGEQRNISNGGM